MDDVALSLPASYRVLAHDMPMVIPGFVTRGDPATRVFGPEVMDSGEWFHAFIERLSEACGRSYLPVMRMSDGEFLFCVGPQPPVPWEPLRERARQLAQYCVARLRRNFVAGMAQVYSSGTYTREEVDTQRQRYAELTAAVSRDGILALHFSFCRAPFQEKFFPAMKRWLSAHDITLSRRNYAPFYFVYAALAGPTREKLIRGRRVLLVTNADADKRARIEASLTRLGAREIRWCGISASRSLFDVIDISPLRGQCDIAFVAAGIGKPNVLTQLAPLEIPCIDVGYMLEVWANPALAGERVYCVPDPS